MGVSGTFPDTANVTSRQITPTQTVFNYVAGPAQLTATFLSPIEVIMIFFSDVPHFADV